MARSDEVIKHEVVEQLYWDGRVDSSRVSVTVHDGIVTLKGEVPSYASRASAVGDTRRIPGVSDVDDQLFVSYPEGPASPSDRSLAERVERSMRVQAAIDVSRIDVTVDRGLVTLSGTVDALWKKTFAEEVVGGLRGVIAIENRLGVAPEGSPDDEQIARAITERIGRDVLLWPERIDVRVKDGVVTLSGAAVCQAAKRIAREAAIFSRGAKQVNDEIRVVADPDLPS
jgi:osmotically-inducible protein OsmY